MDPKKLAAEVEKGRKFCDLIRQKCAGNGDALPTFSRRHLHDMQPLGQANSDDRHLSANLSAVSVTSEMSSNVSSDLGSTASFCQKASDPMQNLKVWEVVRSADAPVNRIYINNPMLCAELDRKLECGDPLEFSEQNLVDLHIELHAQHAGRCHYYVTSGDKYFQTRNIAFWNNFEALRFYL